MSSWCATPVPLRELLIDQTVSYGIVQPGSNVLGGVPIIRVKDIRNGTIDVSDPLRVEPEIARRHGRTTLGGGELLLSLVGTVGEAAVVPVSMVGWNVARAIAVLRPEGVEARWLQLCFESAEVRSQLVSKLNTTVQATLNLRDLLRIELPVPPESARAGILEVLGALDDKIAANAELEAVADELIAALHRKSVESAGASEMRAAAAIEFVMGEAFSGAMFTEPGVGRPLIRIRDLTSFEPQVWTAEDRPNEVVVGLGDVVIGMDATFRPTPWLGSNGLLNQRVCRASSSTLGDAFVREALRAPLLEVEQSKSATTVIHLNKSDLDRVDVMVPDRTALAGFRTGADPLYQARIHSAVERHALATLRDALLPQLMSGKLRVRDAEKQVEELV